MAIDAAIAEHLEKLVVPKSFNGSQFQFQERRLVRIDIDAVDRGGVVNQIVERIAAGAGDHHDTIVRADIQNRVIQGRIFPTLVVDEITGVDLIEKPS
jgi:hypothetical protein